MKKQYITPKTTSIRIETPTMQAGSPPSPVPVDPTQVMGENEEFE